MVAIGLLLVYLIRPFQPPYLLRKSELGGFAVLELTLGCYVDIGTPVADTVRASAFFVFFFLEHKKAVVGRGALPKFSVFQKLGHFGV
jgi:hypothetical protein